MHRSAEATAKDPMWPGDHCTMARRATLATPRAEERGNSFGGKLGAGD